MAPPVLYTGGAFSDPDTPLMEWGRSISLLICKAGEFQGPVPNLYPGFTSFGWILAFSPFTEADA